MATQKKTTRKSTRSTSRRGGTKRAAPKKKPIRREVGGAIMLLLALCVGVSYFQSGALLIDKLSELLRGLVGKGYYETLFSLLLAAYILLAHRGRPVTGHVACALALPLLTGILVHAAGGAGPVPETGALKLLWESGLALSSGGVLGGALALGLLAILGKTATLILTVLAMLCCVMGALRLTPASIVEAFRSRERPEYDPEDYEQPERPRSKKPKKAAPPEDDLPGQTEAMPQPRGSIDIPLDGEERRRKKASAAGFYREKPDDVLSPDELFAPRREENTPSPESEKKPAAPERATAPSKEPRIILTGINEPKGPAEAPAPTHPAPPPKPSHENTAAKDEQSVRSGEVDEAAAAVTREIEDAAEDAEEAALVYRYPPVTLLEEGTSGNAEAAGAELLDNAHRLAETLKSFGVDAQAGDVVRGPSVTRYEFTLEQGVKLSKITNLQDDIALALGTTGVRIAPIPNKSSVVGVEVPNKLVSPVFIRSVIESKEFTVHKSRVAFAVGKDIGGNNIIGDIAKFPHVLIAGTTGSGKSVCTNSLIVSILYRSTPEEVRFIMVDPKMVELAPYNGIPHLLIPVVTDPKKAAGALQWAVYEMMKRYKLFSEHNVKDLASYNALAGVEPDVKKLPTVVVVIDELADLMLVAAKEVEESICRVAQMGRASGMHLVIATQSPRADVITGLMKANIPSRIAFAVASSLESRIILDNMGAEKLVGRGDMLYAPVGSGKPNRVQGCLITAEEIERVVAFVKENGEASYDKEVIDKIEQNVAEREKGGKSAPPAQESAPEEDGDELLPAAIDVVLETGQASVSMLQRRLKLGYSRAARLVDQMEDRGIVGPFEGSKPRQLLITREQWQELQMKGQTPEPTPAEQSEE